MDTFSDALLALAAPRLGVAAERSERHNRALAGTAFRRNLDAGVAWSGDRRMDAGALGSYAEDNTFQWSWVVPGFAGTPIAAHAERLREIGERHRIPELAEPLLDLGGFYDPRAAADDLAFLAVALLDASAAIRHGHGGRALTFIVTDAPEMTSGAPDADRATTCLRRAADLLGDYDAQQYTDALVRGYAEHHGLTVRGQDIELPTGLIAVPGKDDSRSDLLLVNELEVDAPVPASLLATAAPAVACALAGQNALIDHLNENGRDWRTPPTWTPTTTGPTTPTPTTPTTTTPPTPDQPTPDPTTGLLRFGDAPPLQAQEIGVLRPDGTWAWSAWDGATRARELVAGNGEASWAADEVDLSGHPRPAHVAELLACSAARLGGAWGVWSVSSPAGERRFALVDPERPGTGTDAMLGALHTAANIVQQLVLRRDRYEVTRAMTLALFEQCGFTPWHAGEPEFFMGVQGLYQARAYVSVDGTIYRLSSGLFGQPG
ncbi:DUF6882 domain-containing protein [Actinomadura opuntiae]|uniref:DUF6882 domain-containing protein n=1 Tax=Actinomadura sp. OS1-43 TaxID=604315 RepID=UPI00255AB141|nr:DUF6882 domain-containing protein [Actinomadura sp. OS1-43]MDL4815618.1 hypothetical protein [Actinomadura sp. OS1-43]